MTKIQVNSSGKAIMLNNKALIASESGITPTGTISISQNGTYDVTNYASADVNVLGEASSKYGATVDSFLGDVDANGVLQFPTGQADLVFDGVTEVISFGMQYKFYRCYGINSVSFPNLTQVYHYGTGEGYEFSNAFTDCKLTSINFPVLSYIGSSRAFYNAFGGTTLTSATFPALANVSGTYSFNLTFAFCSKLKSLYFPAFLGNSSANASFNNMLINTHDCVVHFPSNTQSVIGSWSSVTDGFGGSNTTVLFDLPATT